MEQKKNIPIKIDLLPENLETLNNDVKRLSEGLEKGCKEGVFGLKESQLLCTSLENFAQLVLLLSQSAQQTLEKLKEVEKRVEQMKSEQQREPPKQNKVMVEEINEMDDDSENSKKRKVQFGGK
jgi:hypothetical protein